MEPREVNLALDFCLRVGEVLLASGAGAADVTATMRTLSRHLGLRNAEIDVTFVNLAMSYQQGPDELPVIATRQVKQRVIDYELLTRVDHLVRDVLRDGTDLKEARATIARLVSSGHNRHRWAVTLGWALMCAGVAVQLGGDWLVVVLASTAGACIDRLQLWLSRRRIPLFYQQVGGAGLVTLLAVATAAAPVDVDVSLAVSANVIMLLAGIGFMGAIQDALSGFYITGGARLTEAILSTAGIIAGVSGGLSVAAALGVRIPPLDPGRTDLQGVGLTLLGSAIGAAAFAYASYAPRHTLAPIAGLAAVAIGITMLLPALGRPWAVGCAAFFVGLVSFSVAGRLKVPPLVIVVSAVVPMLPGLSIYRGLTLISAGGPQTSVGLLALVTAASVAIALSAGVILGEYVAQPLKREARRLESRLAGPRLVGPLQADVRKRRRGGRGRAPQGDQETTLRSTSGTGG